MAQSSGSYVTLDRVQILGIFMLKCSGLSTFFFFNADVALELFFNSLQC